MTEGPRDRATQGPRDRGTEGPRDRETERPRDRDRATERPSDRATEKPSDKETELPAALALGGSLWRLILAAVPWLFALWVGLSRIEDYWHHWEDVAVGVLLGNGCAYAMYRLRYPHPASGCEPRVSSAAASATGSVLKAKGSNQSSPVDGGESETELLAGV